MCVNSYLAGVSAQVISTGCTVVTWVWHTLVNLLLAVTAHVAYLAPAQVCAACIYTLASITAQSCHRYTWREKTNGQIERERIGESVSLLVLYCERTQM